jgi:hypothetical protein
MNSTPSSFPAICDACARRTDAECSALEIMAVSGHRFLRETQRHVDKANRQKIAGSAMARIGLIEEMVDERLATWPASG